MSTMERPKTDRQGRTLLWFSAAFSLAVLAVTASIVAGISPLIIPAAGMAAALLLMMHRRTRMPVIPLAFAAGLVWCFGYIQLFYRPATALDGKTCEIVFTVGKRAAGYKAYGVVEGEIVLAGGEKAGHSAKLYLDDGSPDYMPGDVLTFSGKITASELSLRGGNLRDAVFLTISQKSEIAAERGGDISLKHRASMLASGIGDRMAQLVPGDEGGLLCALLTGDRTRYSRDFGAALINSGTSHVTAVSGMHISIIVSFLTAVLGRKRGLYTALPAIAIYAAMAGFSPSVLRASIMCGVTVLAFASRRENDTLTSLFFALLVLVAARPFSILSPSLMLSFTSTLGIALFEPLVLRRRAKAGGSGIWAKTSRYARAAAAASVGATVLTLPLCILFFPRVSLAAIPATVLILPAISLAMVLGIVVLGVSLISMAAAGFLAEYVLFWPLRYITSVITAIGNQRWLADSGNVYLLLAAFVLVAVMAAARLRRLQGAAAGLIALTAFCMFFAASAFESNMYSEIAIWGQDGAAVILTRSGDRADAVNIGPAARERSAAFIDETLAGWGIGSLDTAVLTSLDNRAAGGLEAALGRVEIKQIVAPGDTVAGDASTLCYAGGGSMELGAFDLSLIPAGDRFIPWLEGRNISVLNLCGVFPLDALVSVDEYGIVADIVIIDPKYAGTPYALGGLTDRLRPKLILIADDGYTGDYAVRKAANAPAALLTQTGVVTVKTLSRGGR